jgi:hypothetical protein
MSIERYVFDVELLVIANVLSLAIVEMPVIWAMVTLWELKIE